jgi:hypothetical protein
LAPLVKVSLPPVNQPPGWASPFAVKRRASVTTATVPASGVTAARQCASPRSASQPCAKTRPTGWFSAWARPRTSASKPVLPRRTSPSEPLRIRTRWSGTAQFTRQISTHASSNRPAARSASFRLCEDSAPITVRLSTARPKLDCTSLAVKPAAA